MSTKENKALVRHAYDLMNRRELAAYFKLLAPEYIEHYTDMNASLEQAKEYANMFFVAFPDAISTMVDMVAEGDKVAIRLTWRGTHKGEFMGIPATGKKFEITSNSIFRIARGKLAELWVSLDNLNFMQQLGVIPKQ